MNNDNQTPSEKTIQDLTETLDLKDQLIEDQKRHIENNGIIITDLQTELSFKVAEYSFLDEKTKKQEVEILEKGIEIEGLKQKNIVAETRANTNHSLYQMYFTKFIEARDKGNEAIHEKEIQRYCFIICASALGLWAIGLTAYEILK